MGRFRSSVGRLPEVQGGSWRGLRDVFSTGWPPEGSERMIVEDLGCILGGLGLDFERSWGEF